MSIKGRHLLLFGAMVVVSVGAFWGTREMATSPVESSEKPSGVKFDLVNRQASSPLGNDSLEYAATPVVGVSAASIPKTFTAAEKARIAPVINWSKYPGTLDSQANRALETRDGAMAMDLANKLAECDIAERLQKNSISQTGDSEKSAGAKAEKLKQDQEIQRVISNCQTIVGGISEMRSRLLDLAMDKVVVGAAVDIFVSGVRRPDVLKVVVADATAGDVKSLIYVSAYKPSFFGIDVDTQTASRWALQLAANDVTVGKLVRPYLELAESLSVPLGGETKPKFDHSGLSSESKLQAQAIAAKLIDRVSAGSNRP